MSTITKLYLIKKKKKVFYTWNVLFLSILRNQLVTIFMKYLVIKYHMYLRCWKNFFSNDDDVLLTFYLKFHFLFIIRKISFLVWTKWISIISNIACFKKFSNKVKSNIDFNCRIFTSYILWKGFIDKNTKNLYFYELFIYVHQEILKYCW